MICFTVQDSYGLQDSRCMTLRIASSICTSTGDPHFDTFDDNYYSFQGTGDFYLVSSANLTVQSRYQPCDSGSSVTCNWGVGVTTPTLTISLIWFPGLYLTINGNKASTYNTVLLPGKAGNVVFDNNTGYSDLSMNINIFAQQLQITVDIYDIYSNVAVGLFGGYGNKVRGMCGTFSNNPNDDFALPNGTIISTNPTDDQINQFGELWRVLEVDGAFDYSLFSYNSMNNPSTPSLSQASFTNPDLQAQAEAVCGGLGLSDKAYAACLFDVAATGSINAASVHGIYQQKKCYATTGNNTCLSYTKCPSACSYRGTCVNGLCNCYKFFTGTDCKRFSLFVKSDSSIISFNIILLVFSIITALLLK